MKQVRFVLVSHVVLSATARVTAAPVRSEDTVKFLLQAIVKFYFYFLLLFIQTSKLRSVWIVEIQDCVVIAAETNREATLLARPHALQLQQNTTRRDVTSYGFTVTISMFLQE